MRPFVDPYQPREGTRGTSIPNLAEMNFIHHSFPICLPSCNLLPQKLKVILSCHFSTKLLFFAKIFYDLTGFSHVCDVLVNMPCLFSLVNLSFVSLICRVPGREPKWVEEKEKFLPLHKSKSVFPSGRQIITIKLGGVGMV